MSLPLAECKSITIIAYLLSFIVGVMALENPLEMNYSVTNRAKDPNPWKKGKKVQNCR